MTIIDWTFISVHVGSAPAERQLVRGQRSLRSVTVTSQRIVVSGQERSAVRDWSEVNDIDIFRVERKYLAIGQDSKQLATGQGMQR